MLRLTLTLQSNASERKVKGCELPPCPVLEWRGLAESILTGVVGMVGRDQWDRARPNRMEL